VKLYEHSNSNVIWFRIDGKRKSSRDVVGDPLYWDNDEHVRIAEKICEKVSDNEILSKVGGMIDEYPDIDLDHAVSVYFNIDRTNKTKNTIQAAKTAVQNLFIKFCDAQNIKKTTQIDRKLLRAFQLHLSEDRSPQTVNSYIQQVNVFISFLEEEGWIAKIKTPDPLPTGDPEIKTLSKQDYQRYLDIARVTDDDSLEKYLSIGIYVIARVRELLEIQKKDIRLNENILMIHRKETKQHQRYPVTGQLKELLLKYMPEASEDHIIPDNYNRFYKKWKKAYKKADVEYYPPKTIRATAESWLLLESGDIHFAAQLAGHSIETAERHYVSLGIEAQRKKLTKLQSFDIDKNTDSSTVLAHPEK